MDFLRLPAGRDFLLQADIQPGTPDYPKYWEPSSAFVPHPPTMEGWERRNELSPATPTLIEDVQSNLDIEITSARVLGFGIFHMVYVLTLEDTSEVLARISFNFRTDTTSLRWAESKMAREVAVLRFLEVSGRGRPFVPKVLYSNPSPRNCIKSPYMILEKLSGAPFGGGGYKDLLGSMADQETFVRSVAAAFVDIFNTTLPSIGSVVGVTPGGEPIMGPLTGLGYPNHVVEEGPFSTIEEFLDAIVILATVREKTSLGSRPQPDDPDFTNLMHRLRDLATSLIPNDSNVFRIALVHTDTNSDNVLINDKTISGLIDWEVHAALPACLAARYPRFLRADGIWDPRYAAKDRSIYKYPEDWPASEEDGDHLRAVFREATLELSSEFAKALEAGEKLRQLVEWVDLADWDGETTWEACDRWEKETRRNLSA